MKPAGRNEYYKVESGAGDLTYKSGRGKPFPPWGQDVFLDIPAENLNERL